MNYDPKDVSIVFNGTYAVGLGESMVSCEKDEDSIEAYYGAQGDYSVAESNNTMGTITVTFQHNSPSLKALRSLHNRKQAFECFVVDKNEGNDFKAGGSDCRVNKSPGTELGNEIGEVEVEIKVFDYTEE